MEGEVYSWVRNIVIYMIINTIIMNLLGNKSYKKYVSIVSGMILVLIVISPLIKLIKIEDNLDYFLNYNNIAIESSDFKNQLYQMEEKQREDIFAEYTEKIKKQVTQLLAADNVILEKFQATIDTKTDSSTFGEILSMHITASVGVNQEKDEGNRLDIKKIEIPKVSIKDKVEETSKKVPTPVEINIKNKLSDFYNIEESNINISIQGG